MTKRKQMTIGDLTGMSRKLLERLQAGTVAPEMASVEARVVKNILTGANIALEHARLTGRLKRDSDVLPDMTMDGGE